MFKKFVKYFFITIVLSAPATALAFDYGFDAAKGKLPATVAGAGDPVALVGAIVQMALSLLGIVFFFLIFYGGLVWMTAQGKTERVEKAKETLEAAIIGLVIVVFAFAIARFVLTGLGGA